MTFSAFPRRLTVRRRRAAREPAALRQPFQWHSAQFAEAALKRSVPCRVFGASVGTLRYYHFRVSTSPR
eukprot:gene648-biopygen9475